MIAWSVSGVHDLVEIVGTSVQAVALVIAGMWAYYRFVKGRVFFSRADFSVELRQVRVRDRDLIHVRASIRNAGGTELLLDEQPVILRLSFLPPSGVVLGSSPGWQQVPPADGSAAELFRQTRSNSPTMVDPAETLRDETLIPLPNLGAAVQPLAWRVVMILQVRRRAFRPTRRLVEWPATAILIPDPEAGGR